MPLEKQEVRSLAAELAAPEARERMLAAEKIAQWSESLDPTSTAALARSLSIMITLEDDDTALEAQLNAVSEISSLGLAPQDAIRLTINGRSWPHPWARDLVDGLREDLPYAPE
jgi:hypothetical protein